MPQIAESQIELMAKEAITPLEIFSLFKKRNDAATPANTKHIIMKITWKYGKIFLENIIIIAKSNIKNIAILSITLNRAALSVSNIYFSFKISCLLILFCMMLYLHILIYYVCKSKNHALNPWAKNL